MTRMAEQKEPISLHCPQCGRQTSVDVGSDEGLAAVCAGVRCGHCGVSFRVDFNILRCMGDIAFLKREVCAVADTLRTFALAVAYTSEDRHRVAGALADVIRKRADASTLFRPSLYLQLHDLEEALRSAAGEQENLG
jgi:hypothetical protein